MHSYLLHNGEIRRSGEPLLSPGQTGYMTGWGVFSTIRVTEGVMFAFERHYARMRKDAAQMRVPFPYSQAELQAALHKLIDANDAVNATLRVCVVRNRGGAYEGEGISRDTDLVAFTTNLNNWGSSVKLGYAPNTRHAASPFAGTKVTSWSQNLTLYEEAHEHGLDEFVLLNENGEVSECTSANIFAVSADTVMTPPLAAGCLAGITRAVLLEEIRVPGLRIFESTLTPSQLESADQVFITSTTRDLLPVAEIDGARLPQRPDVVERLRKAFVAYRDAYVKRHAHTAQTVGP